MFFDGWSSVGRERDRPVPRRPELADRAGGGAEQSARTSQNLL